MEANFNQFMKFNLRIFPFTPIAEITSNVLKEIFKWIGIFHKIDFILS